jgi:sortase A
MPTAYGDGRRCQTPRAMRRLGHIISIALITAGVVLIAEVAITLAYEEPLSSIYGSIKQGEAASELKEIEAAYPASVDRDALAGADSERERIAILARQFAARAEEGKPIGHIVAPDMDGLDMVVVQGTDKASLEKGPGHYPETPFPGQGGTIGIAGHRTTYLAPFRHIDSVERGDEITMKMPYGTFVYRVQATTIVEPDDVEIVGDVGYERLVLSACHPLYSAAERYIVFARLVSARLSGGV